MDEEGALEKQPAGGGGPGAREAGAHTFKDAREVFLASNVAKHTEPTFITRESWGWPLS